MDWKDKLGLPEISTKSLSLDRDVPIEIIEQMEKQRVTGTVITGSYDGQVIWFEIQFEDFALATTLDCDGERHSMKFLVRRKDWEDIGVSTKQREGGE